MSNEYILKIPKMPWMKYILDIRKISICKYKNALNISKF